MHGAIRVSVCTENVKEKDLLWQLRANERLISKCLQYGVG